MRHTRLFAFALFAALGLLATGCTDYCWDYCAEVASCEFDEGTDDWQTAADACYDDYELSLSLPGSRAVQTSCRLAGDTYSCP